jgi:hypothetical protein
MMVNNECQQIGIVSFGESCSMGHRPTVYSSITPEYGWIEKNICALSDNPPSTCQTLVTPKEPMGGRSESKPYRNEDNSSMSPDVPSLDPSGKPSIVNSAVPSEGPSLAPSGNPSIVNSALPSEGPSLAPTNKPSVVNSALPWVLPRFAKGEYQDISSSGEQKTYGDNSVVQENRDLPESFFDFENIPTGIFRLPVDPSTGVDLDNSSSSKPIVNESPEPSLSGSNSIGIDASETSPTLFSKQLGQCEGDCDSDDDCAEGLYCFQRDGKSTFVPGCSGFDDSRTDYCTGKTAARNPPSFPRPLPILFVFEENPPDISNLPLQHCQGDCDKDSDCADGLICYERPPHETSIPGCSGISITRTDFCIDPYWNHHIPSDEPPILDATSSPTFSPTIIPRSGPSGRVTFNPTSSPTIIPSSVPSQGATEEEATTQPQTISPTQPPTFPPTKPRTIPPTKSPTPFPTKPQTKTPTEPPTFFPTKPLTKSPTPDPTKAPIEAATKSSSSVSVTFAIYFDPWPQEVSWKIERENSKGVVASVPTGTYKSPQDHTLEVLPLTAGENYMLTIKDAGSDGIAGIGTLYEIFLTDRPEVVLLAGDGVFEDNRITVFYVPTLEEFPSSAPTEMMVSLAPTIKTVKVYLIIIFDNWHQETAWTIVGEDDPTLVFAEAAYDTYRSGEVITEEISLPAGGIYAFTIKDFFNDGIKDGEYLLMNEAGDVIFQGNGDFGSSRSHTFKLLENGP